MITVKCECLMKGSGRKEIGRREFESMDAAIEWLQAKMSREERKGTKIGLQVKPYCLALLYSDTHAHAYSFVS